MTRIIETSVRRHLPARLAAGLAISALLLLGPLAASARADDHNNDHRGSWDHNNDRNNNYWGGSYYVAPPVYYGPRYYSQPSYYPPPAVYAPGIGIQLPGVSIGIQ